MDAFLYMFLFARSKYWLKGRKISFVCTHNMALFVFSIGDPKQNVNSFMTLFSDSVFYALSHGSLGFAFYGSFFNHSLIGENSSTANKNLCNGG